MRKTKHLNHIIRINKREMYLIEYFKLCEKINIERLEDELAFVYDILSNERDTINYTKPICFGFSISNIDLYRAVQLYYRLCGYPVKMKMEDYSDVRLEITKVDDITLEKNKRKLLE